MPEVSLNWWVVLGAGVLKFLLGGLWYSALFRKEWVKLSGLTTKQLKKGMRGQAMAIEFVGNLLMAYVLAYAVKFAGAHSLEAGLCAGFFNWLGFVAVIQIHSVIFEMKPWKLFIINTSYQLLGLLIMGVVLALWV